MGFVDQNVCHNYWTLPLQCKCSHRQYINEEAWLCFNGNFFYIKIDSRPELTCKLSFDNPYYRWSSHLGRRWHTICHQNLVPEKAELRKLTYFQKIRNYLLFPVLSSLSINSYLLLVWRCTISNHRRLSYRTKESMKHITDLCISFFLSHVTTQS